MKDKKKLLDLASKLVNIEMNHILDMWGNDPIALRTYAVRYASCDDTGFSVQPTHEDTFYSVDRFMQIATACHLSAYMKIAPNADGIDAPTLVMYI